jgi:hypothetical protein
MAAIEIRMDGKDFVELAHTIETWHDDARPGRWSCHVDLFSTVPYGQDIDWSSHRYAYWLGEAWHAVILARAFLESVGQSYQILWVDGDCPDHSYVITTNYAEAGWELPLESQAGGPADDAGGEPS